MKLQLPWPRRPGYQAQEADLLPRPDGYIMFWPTGRCPFRCLHCDLPILSQKRNELTFEEITTFFSRSKVLAALPVSIAGGEPFIRPDLVDILDFLTRRDHAVFVTTNGWYLDRMRRLADLPRTDLITIGVSIDGVGETHDAIRRKGSFERVGQALEIARAAGCQVQVNTVVQPENLATVEAIADYFQRLGVHQVFIPLATFPGIAPSHLAPTDYPDDVLADVARWVNSQRTDAKYVLSRGEFRISDCHAGTSSCYIDPEGDVYACMTAKEWSGFDDYKVGSLRAADLDFDALWDSERAWEVRRRVKSCPGCYTGCEVSRETVRHGLDGTIDPNTLTTRLRAPSELRLDAPTSTPYLTGEWYAIEDGYRWMAGRAGVRLICPAEADRLRVRANVLHPDIASRPVTITVSVDDRRVGRFVVKAGQAGQILDLVFRIERRATAHLAEVTLAVDRVWVHTESGESADRGRLGLMVESIGFGAASGR